MSLPHKELEKWFSYFIRLNNADWKGFATCYTCGDRQYYKYLQDGHYIPRANMSLKYSVINNKPQCYKCNCVKNGNLKIFRKNLIKEYGIEAVEELERLKHSTYKYSLSEMKELIAYYKNEVRKLTNELI